MLKFIIWLIAATVAIALLAGGIHLYRVAQKNKAEMAPYAGQPETLKRLPGRTLVVYYSLSGHTRDIALRIQKLTGADVYEITTAEPISTANPLVYLKIRKQLKKGEYPALGGKLPDFSKYTTIFVGGPVWWYTMATPLYSFLQQADFQGKKVVPFSTQGSNPGTYFADFEKQAKNAKIQKSAMFNNLPEKYNQAVENKIISWINSL